MLNAVRTLLESSGFTLVERTDSTTPNYDIWKRGKDEAWMWHDNGSWEVGDFHGNCTPLGLEILRRVIGDKL